MFLVQHLLIVFLSHHCYCLAGSSAPRNVSVQLTRVPTKIAVSWSVPVEPNGVVRSYWIYDQITGQELAKGNGNMTVHGDVMVQSSRMYAIQVVCIDINILVYLLLACWIPRLLLSILLVLVSDLFLL